MIKKLVGFVAGIAFALCILMPPSGASAGGPPPTTVPHDLSQQYDEVMSSLSQYQYPVQQYVAASCVIYDIAGNEGIIFARTALCDAALNDDNLSIVKISGCADAAITRTKGKINLACYSYGVHNIFGFFWRSEYYKDLNVVGAALQAKCGKPIIDPAYSNSIHFAPSKKCVAAARQNAPAMMNWGLGYYAASDNTVTVIQYGPGGAIQPSFINPPPPLP